jgi:hypothetical protein
MLLEVPPEEGYKMLQYQSVSHSLALCLGTL